MAALTIEEIVEAINAAPNPDKVPLAEKLMRQYEGDDKEIVEPDILAMAIASTSWDFVN